MSEKRATNTWRPRPGLAAPLMLVLMTAALVSFGCKAVPASIEDAPRTHLNSYYPLVPGALKIFVRFMTSERSHAGLFSVVLIPSDKVEPVFARLLQPPRPRTLADFAGMVNQLSKDSSSKGFVVVSLCNLSAIRPPANSALDDPPPEKRGLDDRMLDFSGAADVNLFQVSSGKELNTIQYGLVPKEQIDLLNKRFPTITFESVCDVACPAPGTVERTVDEPSNRVIIGNKHFRETQLGKVTRTRCFLYARGIGLIGLYGLLDESDPKWREPLLNSEYPHLGRYYRIGYYYFPTDPPVEFIDEEWFKKGENGKLYSNLWNK